MLDYSTIPPRILAKFYVDIPTGCWLWHGYIGRNGYGRYRLPGTKPVRGAHLVIYEYIIGPTPQGLTADHLCRVRKCVNPSHLEFVSNRENILRGIGPTAINSYKTHCNRGHEFNESNTYHQVINNNNRRRCRKCSALWARRNKPIAAVHAAWKAETDG